MKTNYFFSGCTANFGVVPWFSLWFFLFAPAFFLFNFLLIRVCVVFEDISKSLSYLINSYNKAIFLSFMITVVKVFIAITCISGQSFANTKDIILSKGEQTELSIRNLENFSVGNKEVIKYKYRPKEKIILLKGKSMGYSDLVIWDKQGQKSTFHIYVTSKREQLQKMEIIQVLKRTSLQVEISGELIYVSGVVKNEKEYLIFKNIEQQKNKNLILNIGIAPEYLKELISDIYLEFYEQGFEFINCKNIKTKIFCEYQGGSKKHPLISKYQNLFAIEFKGHEIQDSPENLTLKFHIVSLENTNGYNSSFGVDRIQASLSDALQGSTHLKSGDIFFQNQMMRAKLLATPEIRTVIDENFKLRLGSEVPYREVVNGETVTSWKFYGLQIKGKVGIKLNKLLLSHNASFSSSANSGYAGPSGQANLYMNLDKKTKLFSFTLQTENNQENAIPWLSKIPVFGELFKDEQNKQTRKQIIVFATIQKG